MSKSEFIGDGSQGQIEMQLVINKRLEAVALVECLRLLIFGNDLHGKDAGVVGMTQSD